MQKKLANVFFANTCTRCD